MPSINKFGLLHFVSLFLCMLLKVVQVVVIVQIVFYSVLCGFCFLGCYRIALSVSRLPEVSFKY